MERDKDNFKSLEKFEKMIQDDNPVYLDLNELEEIIIYYFHEANYEMAEKAIDLANQIFPKSINISILKTQNYIQYAVSLTGKIFFIKYLLTFNYKSHLEFLVLYHKKF